MRPTRLEMEGFGAFREPSEIDFTDIDLVALVGDTGAGKSTIIDAITFALYGSVSRYEDNKLVRPAINQTSNEARVQLDFELGGEKYTAVRVVRRTKNGVKSDVRLECGGTTLAADPRQMTKEVARLLGLDVDKFNKTVVLPQGKFAEFLHDKPSERQATLRGLLDLDVYRRMGETARARGKHARSQVAALRGDLDAGDKELTDERRAELVEAVDVVGRFRVTFAVAGEEVSSLEREIDGVAIQLEQSDGSMQLLASVVRPDGLDDLAGRHTDATTLVAATGEELRTARDKRDAAQRAVHAGPDLASCRLQLDKYDQTRSAAKALAEVEAHVQAAAQCVDECTRAADAVKATLQGLEADFATAKAGEAQATKAVDEAPEAGRLEALLGAHERRATIAADVAGAQAALVGATAKLARSTEAVEVSRGAAETAAKVRDRAQMRAGAAGLSSRLVIGEACPVCRQEVHEFPEHQPDGELDRAEAAFRTATKELSKREAERAADHTAEVKLTTIRDGHRASLAELHDQLAGAPSPDELRADLTRLDDLRTALNRARKSAAAAEKKLAAFRDSSETLATHRALTEARDAVATLRGREEGARTSFLGLRAEVDALPGESTLIALVAEAELLAEEAKGAAQTCTEAELADDRARAALQGTQAEVEQARREYSSVRDAVAVVGPPVSTGDDLVADWDAIVTWAVAARADAESQASTLHAEHGAASERLAAVERGARERYAELFGDADGTFAELRERVAERHAQAAAAVANFDERRVALEQLRTRVSDLTEAADVAELVGRLLSSTGFEAWLMTAALETLVARATGRLYELSSGQFSLVLDGDDFAVRDHTNADEVRSARTLSGGETFLASLSLALALSETTADLVPAGTAPIESIFLDEGFGTLDPHTLDTVATAIEELGSSGRLVGIVTHIRELADRMPVRFQVTKTGAASTVERLEV